MNPHLDQPHLDQPHLDQGVESKSLHLGYVTRRPDVRTQVVGGETVVLDEMGGHIHQLNHTASFIWHACDGTTSVGDIIRRLTEEFDVQEATAAQDVSTTIEQLRGLRLLRE